MIRRLLMPAAFLAVLAFATVFDTSTFVSSAQAQETPGADASFVTPAPISAGSGVVAPVYQGSTLVVPAAASPTTSPLEPAPASVPPWTLSVSLLLVGLAYLLRKKLPESHYLQAKVGLYWLAGISFIASSVVSTVATWLKSGTPTISVLGLVVLNAGATAFLAFLAGDTKPLTSMSTATSSWLIWLVCGTSMIFMGCSTLGGIAFQRTFTACEAVNADVQLQPLKDGALSVFLSCTSGTADCKEQVKQLAIKEGIAASPGLFGCLADAIVAAIEAATKPASDPTATAPVHAALSTHPYRAALTAKMATMAQPDLGAAKRRVLAFKASL